MYFCFHTTSSTIFQLISFSLTYLTSEITYSLFLARLANFFYNLDYYYSTFFIVYQFTVLLVLSQRQIKICRSNSQRSMKQPLIKIKPKIAKEKPKNKSTKTQLIIKYNQYLLKHYILLLENNPTSNKNVVKCTKCIYFSRKLPEINTVTKKPNDRILNSCI